ncbi:GGDEF domain-containing protein [Shewanella yunxiaonensis]|uniref:diguanylate cyclase n=1 Tax=Shewanella yunxiaonensis TaxID=2829809 RepID=A0ABX7YPT3_9GAMM|nr:diguanylate cyclase [Shewanella yunxiaonensis]QUN04619.1 GGDEF domain-containing protein [Shewanella yunxiaonensis]
MTQSLLQQAAQYLKKALPLMLKYQIPTTPTNYALWYTYVGEQNLQLNAQLDEVVSQYQTCPPTTAEVLYQQHIGDPKDLDVSNLRQNMDAMTTELAQSLKDTSVDTDAFRNKLEANFGKLSLLEQEAISLEQVMDMVRGLVKESDDIINSTAYFTRQLDKAQQEIEALRQRLSTAEHDVMYDALTGCFNRRAFNLDISALLQQSPEGTCLILSDIDHFKDFNDTYGHVLGDQVLRAVAKRMQENCRDGIKLYRFGGEEFAVLVPKSQLRIARHLAESLRRSLEKVTVRDRKQHASVGNISASFGVSEWQPKDTVAGFIERTDQFLYEAKRLGRNRVMPING